MVKETIAYTDFDGNSRKEDFWFHMSKVELLEWLNEGEGGLQRIVEKMIQENDMRRMMAMVKDLILRSYGEKSMDGRRFKKSDELRESFEQSEAFSTLYMDLLEHADKCAEFIKGILPSDVSANPEFEKHFTEEIEKLK